MRKQIIIILLLLPVLGNSQDTLSLSYDEFIRLVLDNHPLSRQSALQAERGNAALRSSKGAFDPELKVGYDQKYFNDKNYYQLNKNELSLHSRIGLQLRAGYEQNSGEFLNPEATVPASGLAYAGASLSLGSGLLMDEQRHDLNQAKLYRDATMMEQQLMINSLVLQASEDYWSWYQAWKALEIYTEAVQLAKTRFEGIRQQFIFGDAPAIDTLEAYILLQSRIVQETEAMAGFVRARAKLDNHLWDETQQPVVLAEYLAPRPVDSLTTVHPDLRSVNSASIETALQKHPQILLYENKLASLDVKRRLDVEKLKPKVDINYNFLAEPVNGVNDMVISTNNYKWGVSFGMPLFLREARGKLAMTKINIDQADLDRVTARQKISNEIAGLNAELRATSDQLRIYNSVVDNYLGLLRGEKQKFNSGESSVFLVNSRENSLISAEIKLFELFTKLKKLEAHLAYTMGDSLLAL